MLKVTRKGDKSMRDKLRCYAIGLAALTCLGSATRVGAQEAHSFRAEHNGSVMTVNVGATSEDSASLMIHYLRPRPGLEGEGVKPGTLLFDGDIDLEQGFIGGNARVFKTGCEPLKYEVRGSYNNRDGLKDFVLLGPSPVFDRKACNSDHYSSGKGARLVFKRMGQ